MQNNAKHIKLTNQITKSMAVIKELDETFEIGLNLEKIEKSFNLAFVDHLSFEGKPPKEFHLSVSLASKSKNLMSDWDLALNCFEYRLNQINYELVSNIDSTTIAKLNKIKEERREYRAVGIKIDEGEGLGLMDIPLNCDKNIPSYPIGIEAIWFLVLNVERVNDLKKHHLIVPGIGTMASMGKVEYQTPIYIHSKLHEDGRQVVIIDSSWDRLPAGKPLIAR